MVGGCSRVPKIQEIVKELLAKNNLNTMLNPDEVVAYGATIQAGILSGEDAAYMKDNHTVLNLEF